MLRTARFSGTLAAVIWLVGTPVVAIAGVPFPSDAEYLYMALLATLLGFTLAPVVLAIGEPMPSRKRTVVRLSGLVVCIALILSGVVLLAAVQGWLAEDLAHQSPSMAITVFIALFVWIALASYALRGPTTIERWTFRLGLLSGASCVVPVLIGIVIFYFAKDFVFTNATVLPILLFDLLVWASLPAWLMAVVFGMSPQQQRGEA
jgi:hypothetical protein